MAEAPPRQLLATLRARFDSAALRVTPPGQSGMADNMPTATQTGQWAPLQTWCFEGAGDGSSPLLRPTRAPQVDQRFSIAVWQPVDRSGLDLIEAFSRHLDGSHQLLAAGGEMARLWLRLRVKACDVAWWRHRRLSDPWDCGYALNQPDARAALAQFGPRRATLVVALDWPQETLVNTLLAMQNSAPRFAHPVRWLVVQSNTSPITERLLSAGLRVTALQPRAAA